MNEPEDLTDLLEDEFDGETRVLPKMQHSYPPVAMAPPAKKSDAPVWAVVIGATFLFGIAAVGSAAFFVWQHHRADDSTATATTAPDTATATATATATDTAPATVAATPTEIEPLAVDTKSAPPTTHVASGPHGFGTLQTFAAGRGKTIYVDGKPAGVGGAHVKTACGRHSVAVGSSKARAYEIPCNGAAITVGTPDGT